MLSGNGALQIMGYVLNIFIGIQTITSAVMCVYGYKWRKKLIAIMSLYIGVTIGLVIAYFLLEGGAGLGCLWIIPICAVTFAGSAYKIVRLNHFSAGYLVSIKISYMVLYTLMDKGMMKANISVLLVAPIIIGFIAGLIIVSVYNNYVIILCLAFIGATEFVPKVVQFFNKTLFVATGDLSFIFDPVDYILGVFGIDTVSFIEAIGILAVFGLSFWWQRNTVTANGINLSDAVIDDRNY